MNILVLHSFLAFGLLGPALALDTRALIEQALDEPTKISLNNVNLSEAVRLVSEQSGIKLEMPAEVMSLAPHGSDTIIAKVDIANIPLREGLRNLFGPLGMTFTVGDNYIRVVPKEGLSNLGRPATWAELDTLAELSALRPGLDARDRDRILSRVQVRAGEGVSIPALRTAMEQVGAGTGDEVLTIAAANFGCNWRLADQNIIIEPLERRVERCLEQPITIRLNNQPLIDVLSAVGRQVGVAVRAEPGVLAALPLAMQQNFSLNAVNQPAGQVLEKITSYTGLGFLLSPEGVVFYQPGNRPPASGEGLPLGGPAGAEDPYVGKVVVPLEGGKTIEWLIRASELPADLGDMRRRDLDELFQAARQRANRPTP